MQKAELQRIIDTFHIGKIYNIESKSYETLDQLIKYFHIETSQGKYAVFQSQSREAGDALYLNIDEILGENERLLLPDYLGNKIPSSSYAHRYDKYYSVYKLEN